MPLNEKGKKIMKAMKKQYGAKEGQKVFYAMENSGKLKKVIKARGGMDARDFGKKSTSKADFSAVSEGSVYAKNVAAAGGSGGVKQKKVSTTKTSGGGDRTIAGVPIIGPGSIAVGLAKKLVFDPLTKRSRLQKAKGESFFGKPKSLPTTKDYYRLTGEPIDVMSAKGTDYLKQAGLINQPKKIKTIGGEGAGQNRCPDGSLPPCNTPVKKTQTKPVVPSNFFPFQAYNSGGVSSGPPPKRGPNPQVPPIKMKSGKMNDMSCPHRPDGIRGMGAAIKGSKFIGVK